MPHDVVCATHGIREAHVACVALSACVFDECVALVACEGGAGVTCGLLVVPSGQVVHSSCGVHGS